MSTYAIFVAAAEAWQGPDIATWNSGLIQDDNLVLKDGADEERLLGCALRDLELVRFCRLAEEPDASCVQLDLHVRHAGKIFAWASNDCLGHLCDMGVAVEEMGEHDKAVFAPLWERLTVENEGFTGEIVALVNEPLQ